MADVAGFFYPRTATGRASLLPAPPWYYSGDMLTVEYRTDPARVAELLPPPLAPTPEDPGAAPLIAPGGTFAGTLSAGGRRLAQAVVTLREEAPAAGFVNAHPMAHHRWMPSIEKGAPDALDELVRSGSASVEAGPAWSGEATLELFESPTEELARLEVGEIIGGYYQQVGVTWDGGKVLRSS